MKKMFFTAVCASLLAAAMCVTSQAAFEKTAVYKDGQFTDVAQSAWYANEVKSAYELGFMNGSGANTFSPDGTMTVAEGITIASRVNAINSSKTIPEKSGAKWYDMYIDYAKSAGIIKDGDFNSYDRNIRRYEMAELFANALPKDYFGAKNDISAIPDVDAAEPYADTLLTLYKAGVVLGSDKYGNFLPNNPIKRSEAAAIINRVAIPENRLTGTLTPEPERKEAYYLIDNTTMSNTTRGTRNLASGWNYDNRITEAVDAKGKTSNALADTSKTGHIAINRDIKVQTKGKLVLESTLAISSTAADGVRIYFTNTNGENVAEIYTKGGKWHAKGSNDIDTGVKAGIGTYNIRLTMNLDTKSAYAEINGANKFDFTLGNFGDVARIYYSTTDEDTVSFTPSETHLYSNYAVNEAFRASGVPTGWNTAGKVDTDRGSLKLSDGNTASVSFDNLTGKVVFESYILVPDSAADARVKLAGTDGVEIKLAGGNISCGSYTQKFFNSQWQCLHIVADTETHSAQVYINGKNRANTTFGADGFDGISFSAKGGDAYIDDIKVYNIYDYADYVPAPVKAESKDYNLIMSVCSLWREGTHSGWDFVSPYDECTPILGYYDEGIPETSDWEIKYMAEHGIDTMEFCWYAENGIKFDKPQKDPRYIWALRDGYMYAKYSDMVDFYIMWENASFKSAKMTLDQFKSYLWEYWLQWYLTDSRYFVIDNKPVINIYQYSTFINTFGSAEEAKKVIDFMRKDIKNYGYDDIILLFSNGAQNAADVQKIASLGADASVAYGWDSSSYDPAFLKQVNDTAIKNLKNYKNIAFIPTVATGRNIMGWENKRTPLSTVEQHAQVMEDYKALLKTQNKGSSWQDKTIYFSTWNEFGEGHWLAPSGLNGFGYADVWRKAFTNAPEVHDDIVPTINQHNRIAKLYNDNRTPIRSWLEEEPSEVPATVVRKYEFKEQADVKAWQYYNISTFLVKDGALLITASTNDPMFRIFPKLDTPASDIDIIRVTMKSDVNSQLTVFFTTNVDSEWNGKKSVSSPVTKSDDFVTYTLDMNSNELWKNTIDTIRIDAIEAVENVQIKSIEFLKYETKSIITKVDGIELDIDRDHIRTENNEIYIAGDPSNGIYSACNFYYEWNRFTGKLFLKTANNTEFVFTVGSDTALVNGAEKKLAKAFYLYDHLPVLPAKFILDNAKIKYTFDGKEFYIDIHGKDFSKIAEERKTGEYEFNIAGDAEGWKENNVTSTVSGGNLELAATPSNSSWTGYDPGIILKNVTFTAANVEKIVIRMKYELLANKVDGVDKGTTVYFTTNKNGALGEKLTLRCAFDDAVDDGDGYKLFTYSTSSNEEWKDIINLIRFDPSNNNGVYTIDYIRLIAKDGLPLIATNEDISKNNSAASSRPEYKNPIPESAKPLYTVDFSAKAQVDAIGFHNVSITYDDKANTVTMVSNPGTKDPQIQFQSVPDVLNEASKFNTITVRAKLPDTTAATATFFFKVEGMDAYSADYKATCSYKTLGVDKDGYSLIVFDLKNNEKWKGKVTGIRFDLAELEDTYVVDSINFYKL